MAEFDATTFGIAGDGRIDLTGEMDSYLGERVVTLSADSGERPTTIVLDLFHLRELRLALTRAERWMKEPESSDSEAKDDWRGQASNECLGGDHESYGDRAREAQDRIG